MPTTISIEKLMDIADKLEEPTVEIFGFRQ